MTVGNRVFGGPGQALYSLRSWAGGDDPRHRAENSYTLTTVRETRSPGLRYYSGVPDGNCTYEYETICWYPSSSDWGSNDELKHLGKIADKIRDGAPDMASAAGELSQTLGSLCSLVNAAVLGWKSARKGRFADAFRHWSRFGSGGGNKQLKFADVADATLAIRYGWAPLVNDISDLCSFIEKRTKDPRVLVYRKTTEKNISIPNVATNGFFNIPASGSVRVSTKITMTERCSVPRAMGLYNPLNVAWELTPFSFVVDWFIPVGSYLDNLGLFEGLDYRCVRSEMRKGKCDYYPGVFTFPPPYNYIQIIGGGVTNESLRFVRDPDYKIQVPLPSRKTLKSAFSLEHVENAAALVMGSIKALRAL